jgi:arginase
MGGEMVRVHDKEASLIGVAMGWGAKVRGTERSPYYLESRELFKKFLLDYQVGEFQKVAPSKSTNEIDLPVGSAVLPFIEELARDLAIKVSNEIKRHRFPIILGGDHSIAIGTWKGVADALNVAGNMGLIWVDAHMDAHTLVTSPSKAYHGMPLAVLLGKGDLQLTSIVASPTVRPEHVALIGVRSYEPEERELIEKMGIRAFYMEDIEDLGYQEVVDRAYEIVSNGTKAFGVSIDLDAFDPKFAPGVGSPEANGLDPKQFIKAIKELKKDSKFACYEIVEYNPDLDEQDKTAKLITDLIKAVF